jgi:hypothetical protein
MPRTVKMNRGDPDRPPFLSNLVKGEVAIETPNGYCSTSGDEATCTSMQEGPSGMVRFYGARSGMGKQLTVK